MNALSKPNPNYLHLHVLLALALIGFANTSSAAPCTDNFDGTFSCPTDTENIDSTLTGTLILDNASGDATLNNTTTEATFAVTGAPASITNSLSTVGAASVITLTGNNAVTINNIGGFMNVDRFAAPLNPAGWSTDGDGLPYNDFDGLGPILAGYAAVISAGPNVSALTINNSSIALPDGASFIQGSLSSSGDFDPNHFTAAVFTNSPLLTINNGGTIGNIGNIVSFGTGNTVINDNGGNPSGAIYAVDRNPLLVAAQEAYLAANGTELTLAYSAADVGIRNSTINLNKTTLSGNVFLGSGKHEINNLGGRMFGNISVDQRDVAVVDVVAGVATPQARIHGDRSFTFNSSTIQNGASNVTGTYSGNINIIAAADSVNTINISANQFTGDSYTANSVGVNSLSLDCTAVLTPNDQAGCGLGLVFDGNVTGFSGYNLSGTKFVLQNSVSVTDAINLQANEVVLKELSNLTAPRVVVGNSTLVQIPNATASIVGNLENNGSINLKSNTLNVDGNANMNSGSKLLIEITPTANGKLNNTGIATFAADATLIPIVNLSSFGTNTNVHNGESLTIANHVSGIPIIQNNNGLLQWVASANTGDLVITANIGVTNFLAPKLSVAANNAVSALFAYTGSDTLFSGLQAQMIAQHDENLIHAAERLHPETNDGAFRMVQGNTDKVFGILETRMLGSYLTTSPESTQVATNGSTAQLGSASNLASGNAVWVQGFGDRGAQSNAKGVDGYSSSAAGFALGIDKPLDEAGNKRLGFALGYTRGNVTDTGNTVGNRTDINSFLGAAYGSLVMEDWYVNGMLGVGRNTYDTYRRLIENTATGNHDSWQFSGRVDVGMPILFSDNLTFVPMASLDYSHIKESGYIESGESLTPVLDSTTRPELPPQQVYVNGIPQFNQGVSPTNLQIEGRSFDSIRSGFGGKAIYSLQEKGWGADLELHGLYRHEFGNVAQDNFARFVTGGNSFLSPGVKPTRDDFVLGGSVRLTGDDENDQLTLLTSYDANFREKYFGQIMTLNVRYDFDQAPSYRKGANAKLAKNAAKKVAEKKVGATEKDIVAINQAMKTEAEYSPEVLDDNQQVIDKTIKTWATALSNKNLEGYFNSYAADFVTPDGSTRQQWERNRRNEVNKQANPAINILYLTIKPNGNRATAVFTQTMTAEAKQTMQRKIVGLENRNGRWLIVREDSMALE